MGKRRQIVGVRNVPDKGNVEKCSSYTLALRQVNKGIRSGCYLEAISIEESLLADRLCSTLNFGRGPKKRLPTLGDALEKWHPTKVDKNGNPIPPHKNAELLKGEMDYLYPSLILWWRDRCTLLHGMVKSSSGTSPEIPAEEFLKKADSVASFGLWAFRYVDGWVRRQKNAFDKNYKNFDGEMVK